MTMSVIKDKIKTLSQPTRMFSKFSNKRETEFFFLDMALQIIPMM